MFAVESSVEPFDDSVHVGIELDGLLTPGNVGEIAPGVVGVAGVAAVAVGTVVGVTVTLIMSGTMTMPRPRIVSAIASVSSVVPCRTGRMNRRAGFWTPVASANTAHTTVRSGRE
ncbi:hypothetical protein BBD46_05695 [Natrialba sp. SSL1]|nr:hypothetical protein BBD46_05695 [Natrialba sp. SSL1]